jgi:hypothetical protein
LAQRKGHVNYLWIGLAFLDMKSMPNKETINFGCGPVEGVQTDAGGHTYEYLKNNPNARLRLFEGQLYFKNFNCHKCPRNSTTDCEHIIDQMKQYGFSTPLMKLSKLERDGIMEIYLFNTFLHYRAGTNWNRQSATYHNHKTQCLNTFINELLSS